MSNGISYRVGFNVNITMFYFKYYVIIIYSLIFLMPKIGLCYEDTISEIMHFHKSYISRKSFGVREELNENLCERQNNLTSNPLLFADATGKIPTGILIGNLNDFGQYEQCLSVDETVEDVKIRGKYCMMLVTISVDEDADDLSLAMPGMTSMSGLFGVCVANACKATFIEPSFNGINISSEEMFCREANDKPMATEDVVAIVLFSILGLLLILSTGYHLTCKMLLNKDVSKVAKSFSVHHNMTRLTNIPKSGNPLSCVNGIRALSMMWIVLAHTYMTTMEVTLQNPFDLFAWLLSLSATKITGAALAVDTFFYLAAFLLTWSVLKKFNTPIAFLKAVPLLYLSRYLRLTPVMAAVMLLQISLLNHVSDGPDWRPVFSEVNVCLENWWVNLLYLQNYLRSSSICLSHSWYLAVDMQLYLASPILIVFLFLTIKFAIGSLTVVSLASLGAALGYCFYYNFPVMFGIGGDSSNTSFMDRYYYNTIARSPPFVLGIVVAYVIFTLKKRNITIAKKPYIAFHWIITAVLLVLPVYGTYSTIRYEHTQSALNFFNAWHRPAWALGVGGIIVASMHGFGGPIGWFLSLDIWTIPARLSYSMYLIHYPIMFSIVASQKSPTWFSDPAMLFRFPSDLCFAILAALLLNMLVEAPFSELSNLLFAKLTGGKKDDPKTLASNDKDESPSSLESGKGKQDEPSPSVEVVNAKCVMNPVGHSQFSNNDSSTYDGLKNEEQGRS